MPELKASKFHTNSITVTSTSTGASADVLYTVPANFSAHVHFLHISNGDAQKKITIQIYHASSNAYKNLVKNFNQDANTLKDVVPGGAFLDMKAGDKLVCSREADGIFDVTVTAEEFFDPAVN